MHIATVETGTAYPELMESGAADAGAAETGAADTGTADTGTAAKGGTLDWAPLADIPLAMASSRTQAQEYLQKVVVQWGAY